MKIKNYTDPELVAMIQAGGREREKAFEFLLDQERQSQSIQRLIYRAGGDRDTYREILDDALIALNSCIIRRKFREGMSINAYLYGAARNLQIKKWKKEKKHKTIQLDAMNENITVDHILDRDRREALLSVMDGIGQRCKDLLIKSELQGYKNAEIAEMFGYKSDRVVSKTKCNCMKKLVKLVNDHPGILKSLI